MWLMTPFFTYSQTFTGGGGAIPDNGTSVDFQLPVSMLNPPVLDTTTFGLESVCITINHTYDADLDVSLVSPDGTIVVLTAGNGGSGHNYTNTCFSSTAANSIVSGSAPFSGTYRPQGQLGRMNNGQQGNGTWILHILDTYPFADQGSVITWSITFGNNPAIPSTFSSSNLPIIKIMTGGQPIVNDPKITADMGIINNSPGIRNYSTDPFNDYFGKIGIELRGHSSLGFPQKSYGFETRDTAGVNQNVSLLGLPPENDWILYGPYTDKSLMRNVLSYKLANEMDWYASRTVFCELLVDGEYMGIYVLIEKIKRDPNRVDVSAIAPSDSSGDALTGGYILRIDWVSAGGWTSSHLPVQTNPLNNTIFFQYVYPKDTEITPKQKSYIQAYVDSMEDALASPNFSNPVTGFRKYADAASFIDYFLLNEISKNVDAYRLSTYFNKDRNSKGGRISMGPLWDHNLAWRNADYCDANQVTGWALDITDFCQADIPFWFGRMMQDSAYNNQMRCRYEQLRSDVLDTANLFSYIDSVAFYLDEAQQRHYFTWPILGIYVWPNPPPLPTTYAGEISNLKTWITQRLAWMDANVPGNCINTSVPSPERTLGISVRPNPSSGEFTIFLKGISEDTHLLLSDVSGRLIWQKKIDGPLHDPVIAPQIPDLSPGVYILTARSGKVSFVERVVIQ